MQLWPYTLKLSISHQAPGGFGLEWACCLHFGFSFAMAIHSLNSLEMPLLASAFSSALPQVICGQPTGRECATQLVNKCQHTAIPSCYSSINEEFYAWFGLAITPYSHHVLPSEPTCFSRLSSVVPSSTFLSSRTSANSKKKQNPKLHLNIFRGAGWPFRKWISGLKRSKSGSKLIHVKFTL